MKRIIVFAVVWVCCALASVGSAQIVFNSQPHPKLSQAQWNEGWALRKQLHSSLAWRAAALQQMLARANWAADRLHLPTPHPIQAHDIVHVFVAPPGVSMVVNPWGTNLYNPSIPRETRLRAIGFGADGVIDTTNFEFNFYDAKLFVITRLDTPMTERYALRLDQLIGKPSVINDAQAHELAVQWLAALDVDMTKLAKLKWTVHQLRYLPRGATNVVVLPIYYVRFGNIHYPAHGNLPAFDEPQARVEILGTTRELQNVRIDADALSLLRQPLLLITNALELINTPNPPLERLKPSPAVQTNSASP